MNWRQHWHTTKCFYYRPSIQHGISPQSKHQVGMQGSSLPWHNSWITPLQNIINMDKGTSVVKEQKEIQLNIGHLMIFQYQEIWQQGAYCGLLRKLCHLQEVPSISISQLSIPRYTPTIQGLEDVIFRSPPSQKILPLKFIFPMSQFLKRCLEVSLRTICRSISVYKNKG